MILSIPRFSFKLGNQQKSNRKIYATDVGLRNTIGFRFTQDLGKLAENIAALNLLGSSDELYYFSNAGECDFITKKEAKFQAIQVCFDNLSEEKIKKREIRGLLQALHGLNQKQGMILTEDFELEERINGKKILFYPLWKFLIDHS